jgi:dipeptidyl aminopeptidase/acylaminoacyl peptidase
VHFWATATGQPLREEWNAGEFLDESEREITFLAFADAKTVVIGSTPSSVVYIRAYPSGHAIGRIDGAKYGLGQPTVAGGVIAAVGGLGQPQVYWWSGPDWKQRASVRLQQAFPTSLAISPNSSELAVGTSQGRVYVHRVKDGTLLRQAQPINLETNFVRIAYSANGRDIAVASNPLMTPRDASPIVSVWEGGHTSPRPALRWGVHAPGASPSISHVQFTADGRSVVLHCSDQQLRLFEVQTGGLRRVAKLPAGTGRISTSADGRYFAFRNNDWGTWEIQLFDWRAPSSTQDVGELELDDAWSDLGSADAVRAFRAAVVLGSQPLRATKLIGERLKPVSLTGVDVVQGWVRDLGSEDFAAREAAERELAKRGDAVWLELAAASKDESPERRNRAIKLLRAAERSTSPVALRAIRAVEVLEYADTPAADAVLKTLAGGAPRARLSVEAAAALVRRNSREPNP